jgi:Leucine-rich repeat (LRR) protein
MRLVID